MKARTCFLFKPDGIGDFFLASGVIRLLGDELGEENLTLAVLPIMESVVRGQFPKARVVTLPLRTYRVILNKFAANCLRCFFPWLTLLGMKVDLSISLRNMRDYLQTLLFFSVRARHRILCNNPLLESNRPVRRWTEGGFKRLFRPSFIEYPFKSEDGIPGELEAHRRLLCEALGRDVSIREIWPKLKAVEPPPIATSYWVCAPFSSGLEKDFPLQRWVELFLSVDEQALLPQLVLTGSKDQRERLVEFQSMLATASPELASKVLVVIPHDLQNFIDLLAGADCVTTVDTAAAHAAAALNCRALILFSGKHQGMFAPWITSSRQRWLLPKDTSGERLWHESHQTADILQILKELLNS